MESQKKSCDFLAREFHYSKLWFFHHNWKAFTYTPVSFLCLVATLQSISYIFSSPAKLIMVAMVRMKLVLITLLGTVNKDTIET